MAFLATSEILVELGDDLVDYERDIAANTFNTFRCFLALYGQQDGPDKLRTRIRAAEADYAAGLLVLEEHLAALWQRRGTSVRRHGAGSERGAGGGDWVLPPPIDEKSEGSAIF